MKTSLLFCLLISLPILVQAQSWAGGLPTDSATQKITYQGVVPVAGVTKAELYSRAREWFANTFGSSKAVLEMDDREVGKLVGKAYAPVALAPVFGRRGADAKIWRLIKVEVRDGRYRYSITNFGMESFFSPTAEPKPVERWLTDATRNGTKPTKMSDSMVEGVKSTAESEVNSLSAAMTKAGSKEKDW